MPNHVELEPATLAANPPDGDEWISEIKLDGYRVVCHVSSGKATLFSRTHQDWSELPGRDRRLCADCRCGKPFWMER